MALLRPWCSSDCLVIAAKGERYSCRVYDTKASGVSVAENSAVGAATEPDVIPMLLEGFHIESWAAYGKLKAKIATAVCKESGRSKKRLKSMNQDTCLGTSNPAQDEHHIGPREADPLLLNDPWCGNCFCWRRQPEFYAINLRWLL